LVLHIADGSDPGVKRKLDKIAAATAARNTFGAVAAEYLANMAANGVIEKTIKKNRWLLEDLAAPLSARPIAEIVPAEILTILKRIEKSGRRDTARRLRGVMGSVFRLAVVTLGYAKDEMTAHGFRSAASGPPPEKWSDLNYVI
jgi:integrase